MPAPDIKALQSQAGDFLKSDKMKSVLPYLLSGGAGAVTAGAMTKRKKGKKGEERGDYLTRVLRNAVVGGGLAAGGHALINKGVNSTVGSLKEDLALSGGQANEGPLASAVKDVAFSPLTAVGAGGAALLATQDRGVIGNGVSNRAASINKLIEQGATTADDITLATPATGAKIDAMGDDFRKLRQQAGIPSNAINTGSNFVQRIPGVKDPAKVKGALSTILRRGLGTFGQTPGRRAGRGALALAAAGLPALAGATITNPS